MIEKQIKGGKFTMKDQLQFIIDKENISVPSSNNDIAKGIEEQIPWIYEDFYQKLRTKYLRNISTESFEKFLRFVFNEEDNFSNILACNREVQIKAFNLFTEYFYCQLTQKKEYPDETFQYIEQVLTLSENALYLSPDICKSKVNFSTKGLVKSELYKHEAYKFAK